MLTLIFDEQIKFYGGEHELENLQDNESVMLNWDFCNEMLESKSVFQDSFSHCEGFEAYKESKDSLSMIALDIMITEVIDEKKLKVTDALKTIVNEMDQTQAPKKD